MDFKSVGHKLVEGILKYTWKCIFKKTITKYAYIQQRYVLLIQCGCMAFESHDVKADLKSYLFIIFFNKMQQFKLLQKVYNVVKKTKKTKQTKSLLKSHLSSEVLISDMALESLCQY